MEAYGLVPRIYNMINTLTLNKSLLLFVLFVLSAFAAQAQTEDKDKIVYLDLNRPGKLFMRYRPKC